MTREIINDLIMRLSNLELNIKDPFGEERSGNWDYEGDAYALQSHLRSLFDNDIEFRFGASKMVIMSDAWDFVLKIPFNGAYEFDECSYDDDYEENPNVCEDDYFVFERYSGADSECCWDYCDAEDNKYMKAEDAELEQYFAKTDFLCFSKYGYPIYIQQKCAGCNYDKPRDHATFELAQDKISSRHSGGVYCAEWIADFITCYGEDEFDRLSEFLDSDDDLSSDLHYENVGYTMEGKPIIMDYAGFNS